MAEHKFTPEEQAALDAAVKEGRAMQHRFKAEPLYKYTGKGYMASEGVAELARIKEDEKRARLAGGDAGSSSEKK
jgi:hypothetical protein